MAEKAGLAALSFLLYGLVSLLGAARMQAIIEQHALKAFLLGVFQTIISLSVLVKVVVEPHYFWLIIALALGDGSGDACAILWRKWRKKQQK